MTIRSDLTKYMRVSVWLFAMLLLLPIVAHSDVDSQFNEGLAAVKARDVKNGLPLLEQACKSGHGEACYWAGEVYGEYPLFVEGLGYVTNLSNNIKFLGQACNNKFEKACRVILLEKNNCQKGIQSSCVFSAVEELNGSSDGARQSAIENLTEYCLGDGLDMACAETARYLASNGEPGKSNALLKQACDADIGNVCKLLKPKNRLRKTDTTSR